MVFDHAQSPRLGQPAPVETIGIRVFTGPTLPEVAYPGQVIYRSDTKAMQVFDHTVGAWSDVLSGQAGQYTFVSDTAPTAVNDGDLWYDTGDAMALFQWLASASAWIAKPFGPDAIDAKAVQGQHLDMDTITGLQFTGNTFRTAAAGARWELGTNGLLVYVDDTTFQPVLTNQGDVGAANLTVSGQGTFNGPVTFFDPATMADGVTNPLIKPTLTTGWKSVTTPSVGTEAQFWYGLCDSVGGGTTWATCYDQLGAGAANQPAINTINKVTGARTINTLTWALSGTINMRQGVGLTRIGSSYYLLARKIGGTSRWWFHQFDSTFTEVGAVNIDALYNPFTYMQNWVLGTDGTNIALAAIDNSKQIQIKKVNPASGVLVSTSAMQMVINSPATAYWSGAADFGAVRQVVSTHDAREMKIGTNANTSLQNTGQEWNLPAPNQVGIWYDGTRFFSLDTSGKVTQYSTLTTDRTESFTYAWYDSASGGRTLPSPSVSTTHLKRSYVHLKVPTPPYASIQVSIYAATGTGTPRYDQIDLATGVYEADCGNLILTGSTEPTSNTMPSTYSPGSLMATTNGFSVDGKSNGSVGTGTFRDSIGTALLRMGTTNTGTISAGVVKNLTVTFPTAFPVGKTPVVVATASINGDPSTVHVSTYNYSNTGFSIRALRSVNTAFDIAWIASVT